MGFSKSKSAKKSIPAYIVSTIDFPADISVKFAKTLSSCKRYAETLDKGHPNLVVPSVYVER